MTGRTCRKGQVIITSLHTKYSFFHSSDWKMVFPASWGDDE